LRKCYVQHYAGTRFDASGRTLSAEEEKRRRRRRRRKRADAVTEEGGVLLAKQLATGGLDGR